MSATARASGVEAAPDAARSLLAVSNIEVVYDHVILVLKGVSLQVQERGIVALLGANGAGKTTTLKAISNLLRSERGEVTKGTIALAGRSITALSPSDLVKLGVVQVPVNAHLRGASLEYLIEHAEPRAIIADTIYAEQLLPALARTDCAFVIWRNGTADVPKAKVLAFDAVMESGHDGPPPGDPKSGDTISLSYTSGTTGPPKGVMVTDKMFRASAWAASIVADLKPKDVCFLWEPLFHIGGSHMIVAAIEHDVAMEVNGHRDRLDLSARHIEQALEAGALLAANSDAHRTGEMGNVANSVATLQRAGAGPDSVVNCWPAPRFLSWVDGARTGVSGSGATGS